MPVLIDFGTVKDKEGTVLQTGPAASTLVSWGYTAPEQAAGFPVDSGNLFSLGMTAIFRYDVRECAVRRAGAGEMIVNTSGSATHLGNFTGPLTRL